MSNWLLVVLTILNFLLFYKIIGRDKLVVNCNKELFLQPTLGNIHFYQTISIKNIGSKVGFITKIEAFVRSKDKDVQFKRLLAAKRIYSGNNNSPFLELPLLPEEYFTGDIELYKEEDRPTRDSAALIESFFMEESERASSKSQLGELRFVYASKKLSSIIDQFIKNRTSQLTRGEYEYILEITKNNEPEAFITKCYSFVINQENIVQLNESIKDFKKYSGTLRADKRPEVQIPLTEITNPDIISSLKKELRNYRSS